MKSPTVSRRRVLHSLGASALLASPLRPVFAACSVIPSETQGPYPADGSNGPNALTLSGILRSDIRASFGSAGTTVASGTPLTIQLTVVNTNANCAPIAGYAVYMWHCDAQGRYSLYSSGVTGQNYLRGVQVTDSEGRVTFTTIFPGCYAGRWPHIHFEIYAAASQAISGANAIRTSQLALPEAACRDVYAQATLYPSSLSNLNQVTLRNDNVFSDDAAVNQLASVAGSAAAGFSATLQVGIAGSNLSSNEPDIDQFGLSGMWYEAASSGQGLAFQVFLDLRSATVGYLQGSWFTYDIAPAGGIEKQRWYSYAGDISKGAASGTFTLYQSTGGNFNAAPMTIPQVVGTASLVFSSCTTGQFDYTFSDGRRGTIPVTRLLANATCSSTDARPTNADFALSGGWYDPSTAGQGFFVELNPNVPWMFVTWYTYALAGQTLGPAGQRWFVGSGQYSTGTRSVTVPLYETVGGIFDTATTNTQITTTVGSATINFTSCSAATLAYAFTAGSMAGRSGTISLSRLAGNVPSGCGG